MRYGISQPSLWAPASSLASPPPSGPSILTGTPSHVHIPKSLRPYQHTTSCPCSPSPPLLNRYGISQPSPLAFSVLIGIPPHVHPPSGLSLLVGTSLNICSDTICNRPNPLLANIVVFGLSLSSFLSRFLNAYAMERFSHPYKQCFVLLPNRYEISQIISQNG